MDRGPEYEALSSVSNATLTTVQPFEAFTEAYARTQVVLGNAVLTAARQVKELPAPKSGPDRWLTIPLEPVVDLVIAQLARLWFDIPDGVLIRPGGRPTHAEDLRCPFSFLASSRYVFSSPNPRATVAELAAGSGQRLLDRARRFVAQCRERERTTGSHGLKGSVSRALWEAIRDNDDLLARTLLGLVFGFVPTVYGNALAILNVWLADETLWRVQQRLRAGHGKTPYDTAVPALEEDVARAMMKAPAPALLYRTVTAPTTLGGISLAYGDRVVIGMAGVTREIESSGRVDVMPVFGGNRAKPRHPTHACPGYDLAMGVLLGMLTAVLERGEMGPGPGLFTIRVPNPGVV
jgi:hypothetical protein